MKSALRAFSVLPVVISAVLNVGPAWADAGDDPAGAVRAFNVAITRGDVEAAIAQLAGDGVQFTLRAQHTGTDAGKLATPIAAYWSAILPVVLASTSTYTRAAEVLSSEAHGDIATVWTRTRTTSSPMDNDAVTENEFTEAYVIVRRPDGWKIAAIAGNRQATSIGGTTQ